jgi:ribosome-binding protein aMBF1 (putative translation factor)
MQVHTKKRRTEAVRFTGPADKVQDLRRYAASIGLKEVGDAVAWRSAFAEEAKNLPGTALKGARTKEGLTQTVLAEKTGIPQRHISEMEHGNRTIGKELARKLADVLNVDYRVFL